MKVIFLDIDGVLNGYDWFNTKFWKLIKLFYKVFYKIDYDLFDVKEKYVKRLAKIVKATDAKIVISSSWRHSIYYTPKDERCERLQSFFSLFNKYELLYRLHGHTDRISHEGYGSHRGEEIKEYLKNNPEIKDFIILDDESADMKEFLENGKLIKTSESVRITGHHRDNTGLKNKHVKRAIELLNSQEVLNESDNR